MLHPHSMARQIARTAIAFEEQRLGRRPKWVTVVLDGDAVVIKMHGVLSSAEMTLAVNWVGATKLRKIHQALFTDSSEPLRQEIKRITGLGVCPVAQDKATVPVQVLTTGTVVQVFPLHGRISDAGHWNGT